MTKEQAALLADAHEVRSLMDNEEEVDLLEQHNPALLGAYEALLELADSE